MNASILIGYVGGLGLATAPLVAVKGIYLRQPARGASLVYATVGLVIALLALVASFFNGWGMLAGLATVGAAVLFRRRRRRPDFVVESDVLLRDAADPAAAAAFAAFEQQALRAAAERDKQESDPTPDASAAPPA